MVTKRTSKYGEITYSCGLCDYPFSMRNHAASHEMICSGIPVTSLGDDDVPRTVEALDSQGAFELVQESEACVKTFKGVTKGLAAGEAAGIVISGAGGAGFMISNGLGWALMGPGWVICIVCLLGLVLWFINEFGQADKKSNFQELAERRTNYHRIMAREQGEKLAKEMQESARVKQIGS